VGRGAVGGSRRSAAVDAICEDAAGASKFRTIRADLPLETPLSLRPWRQQLRLYAPCYLAAGEKITRRRTSTSAYSTPSAFIAPLFDAKCPSGHHRRGRSTRRLMVGGLRFPAFADMRYLKIAM